MPSATNGKRLPGILINNVNLSRDIQGGDTYLTKSSNACRTRFGITLSHSL